MSLGPAVPEPATHAPRHPSAAADETALDRFLAAIPYAVATLVVLSVLLWEAATRSSPTVFIDELKWAQLSRGIADTGHAALRGQPASFHSLYAFLIAPVWWLPTTAAAYTAVKYLNEVVMSLAAVPVYLLGRTLVDRRLAAIAGIATLCTSAYFYAPLLLPEVLAYPTFALLAYVSVRALAGAGRRWIVAAIVLSAIAVEVRSQLMVGGAALALAAASLWVVGPRGQRLRRNWSRFDHVGAAILLVGVFVVCNRAIGNHSSEWTQATQSYQGRMWSLGLQSASALALGLGLLPMMAGLASLWVPERRDDPRWRAFAAYLAACIVTFGAYTAVKATVLSLQFATLVEERNLIYLQPLLLIGTAITLSARRPSLVARLAGIGVTAFLVLYYGYQLGYPYGESPGYGIAAMANRTFRWTQTDIRWALVVVALACAALLLAPWARWPPAVGRVVLLAAGLGVAVWMLAAQVTSARGSQVAAKQELGGLPSTQVGMPLDWVDRADHHHGITYFGQKEPNVPLGLWLIEFWNRSVKNVYTIDGTAPGPGTTVTPDLLKPDGTLSSDPGLDYVLQDNGVSLIGRPLAGIGGLVVKQLPSHPWHLEQSVYNVTNDGWITPPLNATSQAVAVGSWAYFAHRRGTVSVVVSRSGFNVPTAPPAHVTVRVGPVALNEQRAPVVRRPTHVFRFLLKNGTGRTVRFAATGPVAVQVRETPTFRPSDYGISDPRWLGAETSFRFRPSR